MKRISARFGGYSLVAGLVATAATACQGFHSVYSPAPHTRDLNAYRAALPAFPKANGHTRSRLAKGCDNCWTDVTIIAADTARFFGPGHPPAQGDSVPVVFITNIGSRETVMYDLKPSSVANYVVYVINESGDIKWILAEVPSSATGSLQVRMKGGMHGCTHSKRPKSEADFRDCDYDLTLKGELRLAAESGVEGIIARFRNTTAMMVGEDPGWVACTDGCCTLQQQQKY